MVGSVNVPSYLMFDEKRRRSWGWIRISSLAVVAAACGAAVPIVWNVFRATDPTYSEALEVLNSNPQERGPGCRHAAVMLLDRRITEGLAELKTIAEQEDSLGSEARLVLDRLRDELKQPN